MLPYWILFFVAAVGAFWLTGSQTQQAETGPASVSQVNRATADRLLLLFGVAITLMVGFRYEVGTDWDSYVEIFHLISRLDFVTAMTRIDVGYAALNWLVARAGVEIWAVNLVCGALFIFGLVRLARHQPNAWLALTVAVPYLIIGIGMGYSRQAVAIGLSMVGLVSISRGSFNRAVLWVLAGALFHRTAVVLLPFLALAYTRNRLQAVAVGVVGCVIGYYVLNSAQGLEHFQRTYVSRTYEAQGAWIRLAMNLPPALLYVTFSKRFTSQDAERRIWLYFAMIAVLSFGSYFFISSTAALDRLALYILPIQIFVLSRVPAVFSGRRQQSSVLTVAVIAYSAMVEYVWLNYSNNAMNWVPYRLYPLFS